VRRRVPKYHAVNDAVAFSLHETLVERGVKMEIK
jgi:hypothetical protein